MREKACAVHRLEHGSGDEKMRPWHARKHLNLGGTRNGRQSGFDSDNAVEILLGNTDELN